MRKVRSSELRNEQSAAHAQDQIDDREIAEALVSLAAAGSFAARVSRTDADPEVVRSALALVLSAERFASALHETSRRRNDLG